jgi:hypothetical protein
MKKSFLSLLLFTLAGMAVFSSLSSADPIKGQKVFERAIHTHCDLPATTIAVSHSIAEWKQIIASGQLDAEVAKLCKSKTPIKPFKAKYAKDVTEFLEHYANDSGAIPA